MNGNAFLRFYKRTILVSPFIIRACVCVSTLCSGESRTDVFRVMIDCSIFSTAAAVTVRSTVRRLREAATI